MFEQFFGFNRTPFVRNISTDSLYLTENIKELMERLTYVARNRMFCVVTGPVGVGKTTALRKFVGGLDSSVFKMVYISDSALKPRVFYGEVNRELTNIDKQLFYRADGKRKMLEVMSNMLETGNQIPIILIDEAHLLSREMLEETRFLLNFRMDSTNPMALVICGQDELRATLSKEIYEPICQRIDYRFRLTPFDRSQTEAFINRHLEYAGLVHNDIFSETAINRIYEYSSGVARKICKVCELSLMYGQQQRKHVLDEPAVSYVIDQELTW